VEPLSLGVLVSGNGTNLQAILDATRSGRLAARVVTVISNRPGVRALSRAEAAGVPARSIDHQRFASRAEFDAALVAELRQAGAEWVVLAGFMRLLTPGFLAAFPGRVINIHPSLLPAFPGVNAIEQAWNYGVTVTGVSVHLVDEGTDSGPIISQVPVAIEADDTLESVEARIHAAEHELYVEALCRIQRGAVELERLRRRRGGGVGGR